MMFLVVCLSALVATTVAQDVLRAYPVYSPMPYLNVEKYCGQWIEVARIPNEYQRYHGCTVFDNILNPNGTLTIEISSLNLLTGYGERWGVLGSAMKGSYPSQLNIQFPPLAIKRYTVMTVLETDYVNYNVVAMVQVTEKESRILEHAWILSRTRMLDRNSMARAYNVLRANNIKTTSMESVRQDNCPAY